jgi:hypothetical protein
VNQVLDRALMEGDDRRKPERRGAGFILPMQMPESPINA